MHQPSNTSKATKLVVHGTSTAITILLCILIINSLVVTGAVSIFHIFTLVIGMAFIGASEALFRNARDILVSWLIIGFYLAISIFTLVLWGLNSPVGILALGFCAALASVLIGSKAIPIVASTIILGLITIQALHTLKVITPNIENLGRVSTLSDLLTYLTVFGIFALLSWLASKQTEESLSRAHNAEARLTIQKEKLRTELEKESANLRIQEIEQLNQLHKFALIGQTAAATLHDLSTQLSILNLDIDDIEQKTSNSQIIKNARTNIRSINESLQQVKVQLASQDNHTPFKPYQIIEQNVGDIQKKNYSTKIKFKDKLTSKNLQLYGSSLALAQIITILINNSIYACKSYPKAKIDIQISDDPQSVYVSIADTGPGVPDEIISTLYQPKKRSSTNGMGIGLYIAQHLARNQLNGELSLVTSRRGAHFQLTLPKTSPTP